MFANSRDSAEHVSDESCTDSEARYCPSSDVQIADFCQPFLGQKIILGTYANSADPVQSTQNAASD